MVVPVIGSLTRAVGVANASTKTYVHKPAGKLEDAKLPAGHTRPAANDAKIEQFYNQDNEGFFGKTFGLISSITMPAFMLEMGSGGLSKATIGLGKATNWVGKQFGANAEIGKGMISRGEKFSGLANYLQTETFGGASESLLKKVGAGQFAEKSGIAINKASVSVANVMREEKGAFKTMLGWQDKLPFLKKMENLPEIVQDLPKVLSEVILSKGLFDAGIAAGIVAGGLTLYHKIHHTSRVGERVDNLLGSTQNSVAGTEIKNMLHKEQLTTSAPELALEALNDTVNVSLLHGGGASPAMMALIPLQIAGGSLMSAFGAEHKIIPLFEKLERTQASGQPVPVADYAEFICAISQDANKCGATNRLVMAMAKDYASQNASPTVILQDVKNGIFNKKAEDLRGVLEAEAKAVETPSTKISAEDVSQEKMWESHKAMGGRG